MNAPVTETWMAKALAVPGFTEPHHLASLHHLLEVYCSQLDGDLLEVGVYCGRSLLALGALAERWGCVAHGVDLFPTAREWANGASVLYPHGVPNDAEEGVRQAREEALGQGRCLLSAVMATVGNAGLANHVSLYRADAVTWCGHRPDLPLRAAFVDGDHSHQGCLEDLRAVAPLVLLGGLLVLDDPAFEGVRGAVDTFLKEQPPFELLPAQDFVVLRKGVKV